MHPVALARQNSPILCFSEARLTELKSLHSTRGSHKSFQPHLVAHKQSLLTDQAALAATRSCGSTAETTLHLAPNHANNTAREQEIQALPVQGHQQETDEDVPSADTRQEQ